MSKFNTWDSTELSDAVKISLQIRTKIEEMCLTAMVSPDDLPNSLIPTSNLYKLVCAYEAAYAELLAQDLVRTGNPKTNKKIH
jgi:hypothetical protein